MVLSVVIHGGTLHQRLRINDEAEVSLDPNVRPLVSSRLPLRRDSATDFSKLSKFNCFRLAVLKYVDVCRCSFRCYWRKDVIPSAARCEREHFLRARAPPRQAKRRQTVHPRRQSHRRRPRAPRRRGVVAWLPRRRRLVVPGSSALRSLGQASPGRDGNVGAIDGVRIDHWDTDEPLRTRHRMNAPGRDGITTPGHQLAAELAQP